MQSRYPRQCISIDRESNTYSRESCLVILAMRGSGNGKVPVSRALRGMKPQHTVEKIMASKRGENSASNGQLIKTDFEGSNARIPLPNRGRDRKIYRPTAVVNLFSGVTLSAFAAFPISARRFSRSRLLFAGNGRVLDERMDSTASTTRSVQRCGSLTGSTVMDTQLRKNGGGTAEPMRTGNHPRIGICPHLRQNCSPLGLLPGRNAAARINEKNE